MDEIVRDGARQMAAALQAEVAAALQAEVAAYVAQFADQLDDNGHRLVVRNGYHRAREVLTARAQSRSKRRGSTTAGSIETLGNGGGSPRRSCRRGYASPHR
ncbi:hypothetical protein BKN37_13150 [Mycobacterium talmoniae]|uniref:Uncharacterized protein n=1 Tax=Mycobacterium talmoniae TaxID=1858794 RepID=A0A1S1NDW8_9MYCO|nr:hypothetical protein BKN37_13150 [Mycobacterium talmoniae]